MSLIRPLLFSYFRLFPLRKLFTPVGLPLTFLDDQVTVCELISATVISDYLSISTNPPVIVYLGNRKTPSVTDSNAVCLLSQPLASYIAVNGAVTINAQSPSGTVRFDFTDGRGNGLLLPVDTLWFCASAATGFSNSTAVVLNILYRQRTISVLEFEAIKSTFG